MNKFRIVLILFFIGFFINAQENDIRFTKIDFEESIIQSPITAILQTKNGFIWIGTLDGLVRYDGQDYIKYIRNKTIDGSLSNNYVNEIFEDSSGKLWIGTRNGINSFNESSSKFKTIDVLPIKGGSNYISAFVEDKNKNIWVGTYDGIKLLNKAQEKLENPSGIEYDRSSGFETVFSLYIDQFNILWIGTSAGIQRYDLNNKKEIPLPKCFAENEYVSKAKIWKFIENEEGDIWLASQNKGVFKYNIANQTIHNFTNSPQNEESIPSNKINDIVVDKNTVWFATNDGLSIYNELTQRIENYKNQPLLDYSISNNSINTFLKDFDGNIWLGTYSGELNLYNRNASEFISIGKTPASVFGLNNDLVNDVLIGENNTLWVATNGGGLNYLDFKTKHAQYYFIVANNSTKTNNIITALATSTKDDILCGTFNGLYIFSKPEKSFRKINLGPKYLDEEDVPITKLLQDGDQTWVGTYGDGLKLITKEKLLHSYVSEKSNITLSDNYVTDLELGKDGLWIATQDGLNFLNKTTNTIKRLYKTGKENSLSNNNLNTLFIDSKERLWIGTDFGGLNYLDTQTGKFYQLNSNNGFSDESISEIIEDDEHSLWISTTNNLYKIRIKKFGIPFNSNDFEILKYSKNDGLTINHFSKNSGTTTEDGKLIYGGSNGLEIFDPKKIVKFETNHKVVFTKLMVNNEEVTPYVKNSPLSTPIYKTSEIELNHDQGYLGLEFTSFNYINYKKNRYEYKLDKFPYKDQWHNLEYANYLNLNGLSNGSYELSIRTVQEKLNTAGSITKLSIIIRAPWWKTWWAYVLYISIFIGSILIIRRLIQNRIKLKKELFLEQVEKERQTELYQLKLDFFTNISHEIRTPLTLINGPLEELIEKVKNYPEIEGKLNSIKQNSDRLLRLINELMDLRKSEKGKLKIYCEEYDIIPFCFGIYDNFRGLAEQKNIDYKFVMNSNNVWVYFDKNQMEKVLYNILSNAFKFTPDHGKISVVVEQRMDDTGWVDILIKDNGIGIPENSKNKIFKSFFQADDRRIQSKGSGVGLALSKSIIQLHKGKIEAKTEMQPRGNSNSTTIFKISLRKGKQHLEDFQIISEDHEIDQPIVENSSMDFIFNAAGYDSINEEGKDKKTILIVDDNEEIVQFICDILKEDYRILPFYNGHDALKFLDNEIPDLIISDVMMPTMDGLELCQTIKASESTNHIPVILLTAKSSTLNRIEGLSLGADSYISKPFSTKVLKLSIVNILNNKEILRQKYSGRFMIDADLSQISSPEDIFVKKLMQIIESNLENPNFDVNELVSEIGMSRTVLYKKVQSITNFSVANLIKNIRLKKAADILSKTSFHVSEVAFMVGFNDRKYFSKEFKRLYKLTPTEYKERNFKD